MMKEYKTLIIYSVSDAEQKQALENELEKYGLERVGTQNIFALPLEEYRTKVQAFKAYLRAMYASIWTVRTSYCSLNHV